MKGARKMDLTWLAACAFQMGLLSGCGGAVAPGVGGAAAGIAAAGLVAAGSTTAMASDSAPASASTMPVRVSRVLLSKPLNTKIQVQTDSQAPSLVESEAKWVEEATTLPPPDPSQGVVLADFRDRQGCVISAQGVELCFRVQPDVDSVAAREGEMSLRGVEALIPASCRGVVSQLALQQAERTSNGLNVIYRTPASVDPACALQVQLNVAAVSA